MKTQIISLLLMKLSACLKLARRRLVRKKKNTVRGEAVKLVSLLCKPAYLSVRFELYLAAVSLVDQVGPAKQG